MGDPDQRGFDPGSWRAGGADADAAAAALRTSTQAVNDAQTPRDGPSSADEAIAYHCGRLADPWRRRNEAAIHNITTIGELMVMTGNNYKANETDHIDLLDRVMGDS